MCAPGDGGDVALLLVTRCQVAIYKISISPSSEF